MKDINYQICRSTRRKTSTIHVRPDGTVRVLVPAWLTDRQIAELVVSKHDWIATHVANFRMNCRQFREKSYISGEVFRYLGRTYRLKIGEGDDAVKLVSGEFKISVAPGLSREQQSSSIRQQLTNWYKSHALIQFKEATEHFSLMMGCMPTSVIVKDYRSRWGCCYPDGRVMYNWRLIIADRSVVNYVVVHELAHLLHKNHSKRFWSQVARVMPDYQQRRKWLRTHGHELSI